MKKFILILIVFSLTFTYCKKKPQEVKSSAPEFKLKVKVVRAQKGKFQKFINYKGTIHAWRTANITPEVTGRIKKFYKKVGDEVKTGELLAELDLTSLRLQKKQAEAALKVAEQNYQDARMNYERMKNLFEKNAVSSYQLEKAQLAYTAAQTQLESAGATLDIINFNIDKSYMRAPFDGVISARNYEEGDMVNPMTGMGQPVMVLLELKKMKAIVDLAANDEKIVTIGQKCKIRINDSAEEFWGEVYSKNLAAEPTSKTFRAEIAVDNPQKKLKANIFADVFILIEERDGIIVLPKAALLQEKYLMIVDNGKAKQIEVNVTGFNQDQFIVQSGVTEGMQVIVEGNYDLQEGQEVSYDL